MPETKPPEITPYALQLFREAEEGLLGTIMLAACFVEGGILEYADDLTECRKLVKPQYFFSEPHARYYTAMQRCEQPDLVGILVQLAENKELQTGDREYLTRIHQQAPSPFDILHYARVVINLWEQRTGKSQKRRGIAL